MMNQLFERDNPFDRFHFLHIVEDEKSIVVDGEGLVVDPLCWWMNDDDFDMSETLMLSEFPFELGDE